MEISIAFDQLQTDTLFMLWDSIGWLELPGLFKVTGKSRKSVPPLIIPRMWDWSYGKMPTS